MPEATPPDVSALLVNRRCNPVTGGTANQAYDDLIASGQTTSLRGFVNLASEANALNRYVSRDPIAGGRGPVIAYPEECNLIETVNMVKQKLIEWPKLWKQLGYMEAIYEDKPEGRSRVPGNLLDRTPSKHTRRAHDAPGQYYTGINRIPERELAGGNSASQCFAAPRVGGDMDWEAFCTLIHWDFMQGVTMIQSHPSEEKNL